MVSIIAMLDTLGALFFLAAFIYAMRNYFATRDISDYWLIFAVAALLGAAWSGTVAIEWFGLYPTVLDKAVGAIVASAATAFAIAALTTVFSLVQPID